LRLISVGDKLPQLDEPRAFLTTTAKRLLVDRGRRQAVEQAYLAELGLLAEQLPCFPSPEEVLQAVQYRAPGTLGATVRVSGNDARFMLRREGFLLMSPVTGQIVDTSYVPGKQNSWTEPVSAAFSLHFGTFGGEPVRWAYLAL